MSTSTESRSFRRQAHAGQHLYLVNGAEGKYLFTGDTMASVRSGAWWAGYFPGFSDPGALANSLRYCAHRLPIW